MEIFVTAALGLLLACCGLTAYSVLRLARAVEQIRRQAGDQAPKPHGTADAEPQAGRTDKRTFDDGFENIMRYSVNGKDGLWV